MLEFDAEVTVRRRRFASEQTGWAVVEAVDPDGDEVILVGPLIHLEPAERAHVTGTWVDDSRYGIQVKVAQAHPLPPTDPQALRTLLTRVKHIGTTRATKLIDRYGADGLLDAIDDDPPRAFGAAGLKGQRLTESVHSWDELRVTRNLHLLLAPHGLAYLAARIQTEYGSAAHRIVSNRPYELTSVFGVGFQIADRIARAAGIPPDSPARARAGILHLLAEAERSGSTCVPTQQLLPQLAELLALDDPPGEMFIDELVDAGDLERQNEWIYRAPTARLERELAERIAELLQTEPSDRIRQTNTDEDAVAATGLEPNEAQRHGVHNAFTHRLSLVTGGPGTGKTASIKAIAGVAAREGARVYLCAPTGRAAIRMSEASGFKARTVHSMLGWIPGQGPEHDEDDPLACDLLILDESSMANLELLVVLLRAVGPQTSVVLVGDADQLAPVGAGKPFAELVASNLVPTSRLNHIFRQAAGSMIVQGAHAIRRGEIPDFTHTEGMQRDLFMVERHNPRAALGEIVELVTERLPAHYDVDPVNDVQVFAPVYKGELGIDAINTALRDALNPDGIPVKGGRLRLGDKLMMTGRNLHELGLMNGTLLRLLDETDEPALVLQADSGAIFRLPPEQSDRLQLAYACSVHRGQGIELPVAVIVAHQAAGAFFLRREMLYTAVTRAKKATVIVGTRAVVARAARTADTGRRHSRLAERLAETSG
jgi:exodeoxyribonuclease V alpha subunit